MIDVKLIRENIELVEENLRKRRSKVSLDKLKSLESERLKLLKEYELISRLRSDVLKALEEARGNGLIGSSQEAAVTLHIKDQEVLKTFNKMSKVEKQRLFIVSSVEESEDVLLDDAKDLETAQVRVKKHQGIKCDRCWNYVDDIVEVEETHLCHRCHHAIEE